MPIDGPNQKLSFAQLESLWVQAGGDRKLAPTMAAIALAESGGNTGNHNPNAATGDDSYGLWQINYFGGNRAPRTARYGPPSVMYNPLANAKAAVDLAQGGRGLGNWSTYKNGAYLSHLDSKQAGIGAGFTGDIKKILLWNPPFLPKNPAAQAGADVGGFIGTTIHDTTSFFKAIPYALAALGGFLLLLLGIALIGADIGIDQLNGTPSRAVRSRLPRGTTARSQTSYDSAKEARAQAAEERRQNQERRAQEAHEARLKTEKARATELRTRTRHRRRNKQQQEEEVRRAYIHGARDAR